MNFPKSIISVPLGLVLFLAAASIQAQVPVLTGFSNEVTRNDYSGFLGMQFTVGSSAITVYALGRPAFAGNSGTHTLKLVNAATGVDVPGGSVQLK